MLLSKDIAIDRVLNGVVAGTTVQAGTGLSMEGYSGILFITAVGALTANQVTALKAQQSDDDAVADDYSDIEGSASEALEDTDGNKMLVLDIWKPKKLYVKPVVSRATANAVIDGVIAIRYSARSRPTTLGSSVKELVTLVGPDEGTA